MVLLAGRVFGLAMNLGIQVLVGRSLGPQGFGVFALGRSVFDLCQTLAKLGFENTIVKYVSVATDQGRPDEVRSVVRMAFRTVLLTGAAIGTGLFVGSSFLGNEIFDKPEASSVFAAFALGVPGVALLGVCVAALRALGCIRCHTLAFDVVWPGVGVVLVAVAVWAGGHAEAAGGAVAAAGSMALLVALGLLRGTLPQQANLTPPTERKGMVMRFALTMTLSGLPQVLMTHLDRFLLGSLSDSKALGIYSAAAVLAAQVPFFLYVASTTFAPTLAALVGKGDREGLANAFQFGTRWSITLTLPVVATVVAFRSEVLGLFGGSFADSEYVLLLLVAAQFVNVCAGSAGVLLNMGGRHRTELANNWTMVAMSGVLGLTLIPRYGAIGAAVATAACLSTLNVLRLAQVYLFFKVLPFSREMWRPIAVASVVATIWEYGRVGDALGTLNWIAGAGTMLSAFTVVTLLVGVSPSDRKLLSKRGSEWLRM